MEPLLPGAGEETAVQRPTAGCDAAGTAIFHVGLDDHKGDRPSGQRSLEYGQPPASD